MTRLTPPAQQSRLLLRQRIDTLLTNAENFPLTIIVAPAGSGKTTALASLIERKNWIVAWCRMSNADSPLSLVRHIAAAFREIVPDIVQQTQAAIDQATEPVHTYLDMLFGDLARILDRDAILILDDYHYADRRPDLRELIEYVISVQPGHLRLVLSTREEPLLSSLPVSRARSEVLQLQQSDLAFTVEEAYALLDLHDLPPAIDAASLTEISRGWPLAVQMLVGEIARQHRLSNTSTEQHDVLSDSAVGRDVTPHAQPVNFKKLLPLLDEYFTQQVFDDQPPDVQQFLLRTAGLRWFDPGVYPVMLQELDNATTLESEVQRRCLFLETAPNGRQTYQPIFGAFLERLARQKLEDRQALHRRAAEHYHAQGDYEGEIYHLLVVGEQLQAARILEQKAGEWISQGHTATVLTWLERLPESCRQRPALLEAHAAVRRSMGAFELALSLYQQAEEGFRRMNDLEGQVRVLRGLAGVYLDTVQPAPAVTLLKRAIKMLPKDRYNERAEILRLQAENWANRGRADVALRLETCARDLDQKARESLLPSPQPQTYSPVPISTPLLLSRLMLRSGRLNEALRQLEADLGLSSPLSAQEQSSSVLAHREPSLLLAFVYTLLGKDARALAAARRGLLESQQGSSLLTEAIAYMRVAHAYQVVLPLDEAAAIRHYQRALEMVESVGVSRTKVEVFMGLALLYGHNGDLASAESFAQEAIQIAEDSGDEWIAALVWVALGGAAVVVADARAPGWLEKAHQRFLRGGDSYGQAVVSLWRALWYLHEGDTEQMQGHVARLLQLARTHGYDGLLTAPTLLGPRDLAMLIPLLLHGRTLPEHANFAQQLLRQAFPSVASDEMVDDYHPGYTLRIQMLGNFRVWRGIREVQGREWQREKARQLLQLLLTYRGQWLQREQICSWLWPDSDLDAAERQFKVTLNALNAALEPLRPPRTMPFFVRRQGLAYSFAPSYGCWIDVDEFELRTTSMVQNDEDFLLRNSQIAVNLYKGDYLAESLYDSWTLEERERLMARYLATATTLAEKLLERGDVQQPVQLCERVLRRDRCYEEAYQVLMRVYAQSGSRSQALRTYSRCTQALQDELAIDPLPETTDLYERIKRNEKV
jgi:ATP/maltotriose-dependent transcriptional regulator MalT/DNA-binding SARP family transcriptional activator